MNENLIKLIDLYCDNELEEFKKSDFYVNIDSLCKEKKCEILLNIGKAPHSESENVYLSISLTNHKGEIVEIFDDGFLTTATELIKIDKKGRMIFHYWNEDKEFIDDLQWIIKNINKMQ